MIKHIIGGDERNDGFARDCRQPAQAPPIVTPIWHRCSQPHASRRNGEKLLENVKKRTRAITSPSRGPPPEKRRRVFRPPLKGEVIVPRTLERTARTFLARAVRGHDDEEQAFLPGEEIVEAENTFALGGAKL